MLRNIIIAVVFIVAFAFVFQIAGVQIAILPSIALTIVGTMILYGISKAFKGSRV